jgi:PKD domain
MASLLGVNGVLAAFGPDRPTKEYLGLGTSGFDHVTFNSFTNSPNIGDERNFMRGKISGGTDLLDPVNGLGNGDHVKVYMYVHNGADPSLNADGSGLAKDLTARVTIPGGMNVSQDLVGFISASNAQPTEVFDSLTLNGSDAFEVNYVNGSAKWTTNAGTFNLSDALIGAGVKLGDDALDGKMNGCFEYSGWVTFEVEVKVDEKNPPKPIVSCDALTGLPAAIKPGDKVDFTAKASAKDATITKYVFDFGDGSNKTINASATQANASHNYNTAGNYTARVTVHFDASGVELTESGSKCVEKITVNENPPVEPPVKELPNTGVTGVVSGVFGTSALGYSVRSWLESRSMLRAGVLKRKED